MAGVIGSTGITGSNLSINGTAAQNLNPTNTQSFATGDVVNQIDVYIAVAASASSQYVVSLYALNAGAANGATKVWEKTVELFGAVAGWHTIPVSNEAITAANGDTLGAALSARTAGTSSTTFKQGGTGNRSNAATGSPPSTWTETGTVAGQIALTVTTAASGDTTAPSFTDGPDVDAVADTTATIGATADESGFAAYIADTAGSSTPSNGSFDAVAAAITEDTPFTEDLTGLTEATLYKVWNQLKDATPNRRTSSTMLLTSHAGASSRVTLGTLNPDPDLRITAIPDLEEGQILEVTTIEGTGTVTLYDDGSFYRDPGVTRFFVYAGNLVDGWGTGGWQTVSAAGPTGTIIHFPGVGMAIPLDAVGTSGHLAFVPGKGVQVIR